MRSTSTNATSRAALRVMAVTSAGSSVDGGSVTMATWFWSMARFNSLERRRTEAA